MANSGRLKELERETYDAIAEAYDARMAWYNGQFAADMVDLLYPQDREAALDVAGGSGPAGLRLAERIGPLGQVAIVDISPRMLRLARRNAAKRKLDNVRVLEMDAEDLGFQDDSFDIVTCAFGVMSFPDVPRAIAEMTRVLKPGGRIGLAVWSIPERFPLYSEPMTAFIRRMAPLPARVVLRTPVVGPTVLRRILISGNHAGFSPSRFCEKGSLERYLSDARLHSVRRVRFAYALKYDNFEEYWDALLNAMPGGSASRTMPEPVVSAIREELRARLVSPRTREVRLFNEAAVVLAKKPV